eukprot:CAMPEP_0172323224 /NCGR_PEP_ID=MMETSP1058-20130122/48208_1 /TAXON_ID=83371 /ORGANISM="Detonula confervacea, Strain CCMP 353" /LENGTH=159 /DNA_ID=CAMNT_0013039177 /DNA_START=78 /DNA_END=554 /DNA_ORIENTATION=-
MVSATIGLLQTNPGTALGGRSRLQLAKDSVPSNMHHVSFPQHQRQQPQPPPLNSTLEMLHRERPMLSQVNIEQNASDVSSIPDYDIFSHTKSEVLRNNANSKKQNEMKDDNGAADEVIVGRDGSNPTTLDSDDYLFAGLGDDPTASLAHKGKQQGRITS